MATTLLQRCHGIEEFLTISVGNRPQTGIGDIASWSIWPLAAFPTATGS
jgi:hypothetical protein